MMDNLGSFKALVLWILMEYYTREFVNGETTMTSFRNRTVPICSIHSCQTLGCGYTGGPLSCACDQSCQYFGDCCTDYKGICSQSHSPGSPKGRNEKQTFSQVPHMDNLLRCTNITGIDHGYWTVSVCPTTWINPQIRNQCEYSASPVKFDMTLLPVVYNTSISYKNVYCALCNGLQLTDVMPWEIEIMCPLPYTSTLDPENFKLLDLISDENCTFSLVPPFHSLPIASRSCVSSHLTDSCPDDAFPELNNICSSFTGYVRDEEGNLYKNPYCRVCNSQRNVSLGESLGEIENICLEMQVSTPRPPDIIRPTRSPGGGGTGDRINPGGTRPGRPDPDSTEDNGNRLQPFSIIMDFSGESSVRLVHMESIITTVKISCQPGEVYDPFSQDCLTVSCADGYELHDNTCHRLVPPVNLTCGEDNADLSLKLFISVTGKINRLPNCLSIIQVKHLTMSIARMLSLPPDVLQIDWINETANSIIQLSLYPHTNCNVITVNESAQLHFKIDPTSVSYAELEDIFDRNLLQINPILKSSEYSLDSISISQQCVAISELGHCRNALSALSDAEIVRINGTTFVRDNASNSVFHPYEVLLTANYHVCDKDYQKELMYLTCNERNILTCPTITKPSHFFIPLEGSKYINNTVSGEVLGPMDYSITANGSIRYCTTFQQNATRNQTQQYDIFTYDRAQVLLSYIGVSISLASLFITFATYCTFYHMRRCVSNKLIMVLCVLLFTAQLLQLLSGFAKSFQDLCTTLSVVAHFTWTSVFATTTCLAFELSRTLGSRDTLILPTDSNTAVTLYVAFILSTSSILVATCLTIHFTLGEELNFSYGGKGVCWINNQRANLIAFGCPLGLFLLVNVILFLHTVSGIRNATKIRNSMLMENKNIKETSTELRVYLKISTLLGFTWSFGFIAGFAGVRELWYIFIILNSLQGLYIFLAFIANRRVYNKWFVLLCHCRRSGMTRHSRGTSSMPFRMSRMTSVTSLPRSDTYTQSASRRHSGERVPGSRMYSGVNQKVSGDRRNSGGDRKCSETDQVMKNADRRYSGGDRGMATGSRRYSRGESKYASDRKYLGERKYLPASDRRYSSESKSIKE